jgi:beta-lactamase family protein
VETSHAHGNVHGDDTRVPAALPTLPPAASPVLLVPGSNEVSFGHLVGIVGPGTRRILVRVDGRLRADRAVRSHRFDFALALPRRDVTLTVTAVDRRGHRASTVVGPVYGLPRTAAPRAPPLAGYEDTRLARTLSALVRAFPGTCAVFVQHLGTGAGAAWNARAHIPAASTLKVAIALEVLRVHDGKPAPGTLLDNLLRRMLIYSDGDAANQLLVWLGGSTSGGSAHVNATMRALGLTDSEMYGGYEVTRSTSAWRRKPIPLRLESQPSFVGKYTTAWDLGRLMRYLHVAADGKALPPPHLRGTFVPAEARFLLFILARVKEPGRLDRYLRGGGVAVLHKAGWITHARHDAGLVYWPGGAFVAVVMTWDARSAGMSSDVLAGRLARAALDHFSRRN